MNELGQWLRETRENKGLNLAEAEAKTRIRQRFLAALEAEEWNALPGDVTARGFLRKYAAFLGLDVDEVMALYGKSDKAPEIIEEPDEVLKGREVDYRPIEMNLTGDLFSRLSWRPLAIVAVIVLLIAAAWYIVTFSPGLIDRIASLRQTLPEPADLLALESTPEPTATRIVIRVTATPSDTPPVSLAEASGEALDPAAEGNSADAQSSRPVVDALQLDLKISQRSWVRIAIDGEVRLETVLEPGDETSWRAQNSIVLRTGNASGALVTINGDELPPLGGAGEVVELQWLLLDGKIVEITPTPMPGTLPTTEAQMADDSTSISPTVTATLTTTPTLLAQVALSEAATEDTPTAEPVAEVTPTATPNPTATPRPTATPQPTATPTAIVVAQTNSKLLVQLEIIEEAWIRVTVDGETRLEQILAPGTQQDWQGERSIQLRIGNAGGVKLKINGQTRENLGQTGQVVDLVWSIADNGRIVESTPTPRPPTSSNQSTASNFQG